MRIRRRCIIDENISKMNLIDFNNEFIIDELIYRINSSMN